MRFQKYRCLVSAAALICCAGLAQAGSNVVTDAIDPDCTVEKAAKGAAMKAIVGVGNRCDAAETARDVSGVDGKADDAINNLTPKPGKKIKN